MAEYETSNLGHLVTLISLPMDRTAQKLGKYFALNLFTRERSLDKS